MLLKLLSLPIRIALRILGSATGSLRMFLSTVFSVFIFVFKNIPGIALGIIAGVLLGKKQFR